MRQPSDDGMEEVERVRKQVEAVRERIRAIHQPETETESNQHVA